MFACCDIVAFFGGLPPACQCCLPAPSCGASGKGATWRCPAYKKISRLKAHRVAADSKRQCRQLFEYPAQHIIIRGVFQRTARKAAQSRGRVSTGASLATCCQQLQLQHMLLSASSNMLSSCCMRRFLSLISIAIAIVARVSAIRSQLLPSPHSALSSTPHHGNSSLVLHCSLHRLRCHKSLPNMLFITRPPVPATRCGFTCPIWKPS